MREQCIRAVETAMNMSREEIARRYGSTWDRGIEERIRKARLQASRADPESFRALDEPQQLLEGARIAGEQVVTEAEKKRQRAESMILGHDRISNFRSSQVTNGNVTGDKDGIDALSRMMAHHHDERNGGMENLEDKSNAGFNVSYAAVADVFDTINPGLWRRVIDGQWTMEPMRKALTDALHGVNDPSIPEAIRKGAEQFHKEAEALRERFNARGGVIGKREDWGSTHEWSERLVEQYPGKWRDDLKLKWYFMTGEADAARALRAQMLEKAQSRFVENMTRWANRRSYVHDDGSYLNTQELRDFFAEAWKTIRSGGWTKEGAGGPFPGGAVKANRGSHHRVIHLQPEHAYEALKNYSERNILESMVGTLKRMNRDVAAVDLFGANPDYQVDHQIALAIHEASQIDPSRGHALEAKAKRLRYLYDHLAGNNPRPANRAVSDAFATARNIQIFKLASSALTSISDWATLYQGAIQNRLNPFKVMLNSTLAWAPESRRYARRIGLVAETMIADLERMSAENLSTRTLSAKTASGVMRASFLTFVTNARRMGFSMTLMDAIGHLTRKFENVSDLDAHDHRILAAKGISQDVWDIWRAADLDNWGANHTLLTPDAIMKMQVAGGQGPPADTLRDAAIKLLSIVNQEQDLAVITPGAREQVAMRTFFGATAPGTVGGEIARSVMLFKSFSVALLGRQGERAAFYHGNEPTWASRVGRFGYMGRLFVIMAVLGALRNWIMDVINGKDPRPMNPASSDPQRASLAKRNWMQAALTGGGLGIYGDFLFAEDSRGQSTFLETGAGPLASTVGAALNLGPGNIEQAAYGEPTDAGAEALRVARGNTPFTGLPYIRSFADRYIWYGLQDWASPGSVDRSIDRDVRLHGARYWWDPRTGQPSRAPDLSAGVE